MLGIIWLTAKVIVLGFMIYVVGMIILYEIVEYFGRAYNRANMLRQMQYRRLSPPRNRQIYFENGSIIQLTGYANHHRRFYMIINLWVLIHGKHDKSGTMLV